MNNIESKTSLFGRENIFSLLNRRIADLKDGYRQNIALLGNAFIGKTTILKEFIKNLKEEKVLPIYLELENLDFACFVNKYIGILLFNYLKIKSQSRDENLEILLENAKRFIPATVDRIKKLRLLLEKGKHLEAYKELIDLPQAIFEEAGIFCLVIFDEFQNLEEFALDFAFQELGKKIMLQKSCLYVVSSSQKPRAKKILSEKLSLLFGNFDLVDIFAFDAKTSRSFLEEKFSGLQISADYKNFLIDFTAGYPFYLDAIFREISKSVMLYPERPISPEVIIEALYKLLFEKKGFFYQHFELILEKIEAGGFKRSLTQLMAALASGQNKLKDISGVFSKEKNSIAQKLSRLIDLNVISKNGNFYYICDRLFGFWLKAVYQVKRNSFNYDAEVLEGNFKELLKKSMNDFSQIAKKDLSRRVIELFYSFDNEYFQFNGHKYRLPIFKEIEPLKIEKERGLSLEAILAVNPEMSWLVLLKEGAVCETELNNFLERIKNFNLKPAKKILIYVSDIEPNARLKALQEKIWLWNLTDLNLLMNFYHRPYFIK